MSEILKTHAYTIARAFVNWYVTEVENTGKCPSKSGAVKYVLCMYDNRKNPDAPVIEREYVEQAAKNIAEQKAEFDGGDWWVD